MEGLENFKGLFEKPIEYNLKKTFNLSGDIEFAMFCFLDKCQKKQKVQNESWNKLTPNEKKKRKKTLGNNHEK
jgi:hypothetical protein